MADFMMTETEFAAKALKRRSGAGLYASSATYDPARKGINIVLTNGICVTFPLSSLPGLHDAPEDDLGDIVVEGKGYGLYFPALDVDISVPQLFADTLGSNAMLKAYKRQQASRANGQLGGRPRMKPTAA